VSYLENKKIFFCLFVFLHFTWSGFLIHTTPASVVVEKGSNILVHAGPRELDGSPWGGIDRGLV